MIRWDLRRLVCLLTLLLLGCPFEETIAYLLPSSVLISLMQVLDGRQHIGELRSKIFVYCVPWIVVGLALVLSDVLRFDVKLLVGITLVFSAFARFHQGLQQALVSMLKLFGADLLEQNEWERDSLLVGKNGADGLTWVLTRPVRPTKTPFVGAFVHKDERGPMNCSIYDHGDFCLYCVASSEWDRLAPHVSSGLQPKE